MNARCVRGSQLRIEYAVPRPSELAGLHKSTEANPPRIAAALDGSIPPDDRTSGFSSGGDDGNRTRVRGLQGPRLRPPASATAPIVLAVADFSLPMTGHIRRRCYQRCYQEAALRLPREGPADVEKDDIVVSFRTDDVKHAVLQKRGAGLRGQAAGGL